MTVVRLLLTIILTTSPLTLAHTAMAQDAAPLPDGCIASVEGLEVRLLTLSALP